MMIPRGFVATPGNRDRDSRPSGLARRKFLGQMQDVLTGAALWQLLSNDLPAGIREGAVHSERTNPLQPALSHVRPRAKAVIQLFMQGGPSQVDLFDPKPALQKHHGESAFDKLAADVSSPTAVGGLMKSPFAFSQHGESGLWVSELLPHLSRQVDRIAVVRSMYNSHPNHEPALFKIQSGRLLPGLPSLGSWIVYGLGTENRNLPAYVVLDDPQARLPTNGVQNWQAGYLPPVFQGTRMRPTGSPILNLKPERDEPSGVVGLGRELLGRLDRMHLAKRQHVRDLPARISSYELAARMQMHATDALDLEQETETTQKSYGIGNPRTDNYARRCLMARRLVERGVRFVQIYTKGQMWDNHSSIGTSLKTACEHTDQPVAALLDDLFKRGLLDDVLVIWGGEFGRLPIAQIKPGSDPAKAGRDHGPAGFSLWMAGAGIRGGTTYGATDDIGYRAVENPVSVGDWHATVLHALGLDYRELSFDRHGLEERITGVAEARVVSELFHA